MGFLLNLCSALTVFKVGAHVQAPRTSHKSPSRWDQLCGHRGVAWDQGGGRSENQQGRGFPGAGRAHPAQIWRASG